MTEGNGVRPAGVLTPLRRNRFFYGKLMDTRHWELEQEYGIRSRRLINRLGLGAGILCGLGVRIADDGVVCIAPGVAVDGSGREIVVTETVSLQRVDQLTDECAQPIGEPVRNGDVTIWLCYHECGSEYTRLAGGDCGHRDRCVPGLLDERYAVRIGVDPPDRRPGLSIEQCSSIFPADAAGPPQRQVIAELLAGPCGEAQAGCVALATVRVDDAGTAIDVGVDYRTPLYSNEELFDLLLCLASRVEQCCHQHPVLLAPRVMDVWPPLKGEIAEDDLLEFNQRRRMEIVFEREMRDLALDQPDSWLGVWQIDGRGAARLPLTRAGGAFERIAPQPGQEGVAYDVGIDGERNDSDLAFVVMMRAAPGGDVVARDDGAALDADFAGTALAEEQRTILWNLAPDRSVDPSAVRDGLLLAAAPSLPSGDGVEGGQFHGAAARTQVVEVVPPPQLLAVAPAGATVLDPQDPGTAEDARRFLERPQLRLTVSRAIDKSGLESLDGWLRVFKTNRDGPIYGFDPVKANFSGVELNEPDGPPEIHVDLDPESFRGWQTEIVVIVRPGNAPAGAEPRGEAEPQDLLDADFAGTSLDKQVVISIFDGIRPDPIANLDPVPTDGVALYDGAPGGLVHYSFIVRGFNA